MARFAVRSRECRARPTKSTRAGSWRKDDDRAQISKAPPLGARSAIRSRERRVRGNCSFFPIWPAAVLFRANLARPTKSTRAGSCAATDDKAQISQPPPSYGSLRNPITGVPRARKLKLFCSMARRNPLPSLARPTKRTCTGSWRKD